MGIIVPILKGFASFYPEPIGRAVMITFLETFESVSTDNSIIEIEKSFTESTKINKEILYHLKELSDNSSIFNQISLALKTTNRYFIDHPLKDDDDAYIESYIKNNEDIASIYNQYDTEAFTESNLTNELASLYGPEFDSFITDLNKSGFPLEKIKTQVTTENAISGFIIQCRRISFDQYLRTFSALCESSPGSLLLSNYSLFLNNLNKYRRN